MQAKTKCLRRDLNTLKDWICQIAEFEKRIAVEFEKTINESLDYIGEAEKTIAKIAGALSNEYTNSSNGIGLDWSGFKLKSTLFS